MRGFPPSANPRDPRGFTLIELLVVVVIIAVLAGAVALAVGAAGGERQLAREAEQMRALLGYACEEAELSGRDVGISLDAHGYRFSVAAGGDWLPAQMAELRARTWLGGTAATLTRDGRTVTVSDRMPEKPQLACFASGELTPFRLELALADLSKRWRLDGQPDGDIKLSVVDAGAR